MVIEKAHRQNKITIAVIGGSECCAEEAALAEQVGREIARCGATLVCGGLGGIMAAACRGANSEGGMTIGILPGKEPSAANKDVKLPIATGLGHARNFMVVQASQVVIAISGEYGTLSEIAIALKLQIPVIGLNTWSLMKRGKMDNSIILADDAADAVAKAIKHASKAKKEEKDER
ncbi:MAG: TIGR00725 family protein [Dehalococcoidia bacterium]|nr:TIGR00725 family protein [Dehalococcoidia bacterium]MDD5494975.1 TIGR00725 family protein [Dehalococcoidia bacterium]